MVTQLVQLVTLDRDDKQPAGLLPVGRLTSYLFFAVGWALFGWAAVRACVFPRPIAIAVIVGGVVGIQLVQPPLGVPLGLALTWLGVWLLRNGRTIGEPRARPSP